MRHDQGLAASPPVRYILEVERSGCSPFHSPAAVYDNHPTAWKGYSRKLRLCEDPPEQPGGVDDEAIQIHRQVRSKPPVETHEPVGPAPVARLKAGVALWLR